MAVVTLGIGGCRGAGGTSPRPAGSRPRNLLLVVVDTLRQDHLKAYGYERETAPTFSRLAAEGALVDAVSPTSWTKPSVASILTGLHPLRHQVVGDSDVLPESARPLAERLRARGYRSFGITANGWLSRRAGFAQGFDEYLSMLDDLGLGQFSTAAQVNAQILPHLDSLKAPFLLYVHYLDPHAPYEPAISWDGGPLRGRLAARHGMGISELQMDRVLQRPTALLEDARDLYDGEIRSADDGIGQLLDELRRRGLLEGTLTIVTSDHGEEMQEHGRMGHGQSLYEEVVRVPLLFHAPGFVRPGARAGAASLLDIVPTVLDLLGIPLEPGSTDGVSLSASLQDGSAVPADRSLLLQVDHKGGRGMALRTPRYKLVLEREPYRKELFDLSRDPREAANLLLGDGASKEMVALAERAASEHNGLMRRALPLNEKAESAETQEAMAALGYLGETKEERRRIPARIVAADVRGGGLLGWEDAAHFKPCIDLLGEGDPPQLLLGWRAPSAGGRRAGLRATAALALPRQPAPAILTLRGRNEAEALRIRVSLEGREVGTPTVTPGAFEIRLPTKPFPGPAPALLQLEREGAPEALTFSLICLGAPPPSNPGRRARATP